METNTQVAEGKEQGSSSHGFRTGIKKRSDRLMNYFLVCYFLTGLGLAFFYDTWLIAFGSGGLCLVAYYSVKIALPRSDLYQYVLSTVLGIFMAQFIYQMHGMFEMHFFAFIGSALLITYQKWKLQVPMLLFVIVHHLAFGYLQNSGRDDVYFTQLDYFELESFVIHFVLAAVVFFICGLWGYLLKKYSDIQIAQRIEMEELQRTALLTIKEQAAIESNSRFSYAAQATSDAIWDRNYSEEVIFWGDGYHSLFGYEITPETTSVSFWASKVHPEDVERITKTIRQAKEDPGTSSWSSEYRFLKSNGEYSFVREKAVILRDEKGVAYRTIGALQDITETRQSELVLKELNENLEKEKYYLDILMNNMPDAIYFKDQDSKFLRVSKFMANKFGTTVTDIVGKSDFDFHDISHATLALKDEGEIQKTRIPKIDYVEQIKKNGTERWLSSTKMPLINSREEVVGTFGMSRDITRLKKLEKEQHQAALDKAVSQGKFEIASEVMHDIGNAVVGFGSYLTRIKRLQEQGNQENLKNLIGFFEGQKAAIAASIGETKADAVVNMLNGIAQTEQKNQDETAKSITEQLNIIANIEGILNIQRQYVTGHESKERKPADLKTIINDSLSILFSSVDKTGLNITLSIADDLPPIKGDRTKLMQLLLNVFKNSIEATDKNESEKNICISADTDSGKLVVQVKDNGSGFNKAVASQIFTRGFTTKTNGTGQSLYNCKAIAESHEGTIDITSEGEGKGATTRIGFKV
ncbi:MAG: PAS domain S-box protein [Chitinophagaceae bacterium]